MVKEDNTTEKEDGEDDDADIKLILPPPPPPPSPMGAPILSSTPYKRYRAPTPFPYTPIPSDDSLPGLFPTSSPALIMVEDSSPSLETMQFRQANCPNATNKVFLNFFLVWVGGFWVWGGGINIYYNIIYYIILLFIAEQNSVH